MTATRETLSFHIDVFEDILLGSPRYPPPSFELEDVLEQRRFASEDNERVMDPAAVVLLLTIAERWQDSDGDSFGWGLSAHQCDFYERTEARPREGASEACYRALQISMASVRELFDVESRLRWLRMTLEVENFADWECVWAAALLAEHGRRSLARTALDWSVSGTIGDLRSLLPELVARTERLMTWTAASHDAARTQGRPG